jgi:hypothetical protein
MGDSAGRDEAGFFTGCLGDLTAGLVDYQLDQGACVEIETQRRPSETYSEAVGPGPISLTRLGVWCRPFPGRTVPLAISLARPGEIVEETIVATGLPRRVTVIASPLSTCSTIRLVLFFNSRMPTVLLM